MVERRSTLTHSGTVENALAKRRRDIDLAFEQISIRTGITENELTRIENSMLEYIPQELVEKAIIEKGIACQRETLKIELNKRAVHEMPVVEVVENFVLSDPKRQVQEVPAAQAQPQNIIMFSPRTNEQLRKRLKMSASEVAVRK